MDKYPYFIVPAIERLPEATGEERLALVRRIAAAVGDPVALRAIIGIDPEEFMEFYPDMKSPELTTGDTIDSFLDRFGDPNMTRATEIEDIITPVAVPYDLSSLESLPEIGDSDLFGEAGIPEEPRHDAPSPSESEHSAAAHDTNLSESLARIMVKNGNYQKALEIITEISLNNPKKSIYFADQIRFLKKLIAYTSDS